VVSALGLLTSNTNTLDALLTKRTMELSQCRDWVRWQRNAVAARGWMAHQETVLENDDMGDSISSVEELIKLHDAFEQGLRGHSDDIKALDDHVRAIGFFFCCSSNFCLFFRRRTWLQIRTTTRQASASFLKTCTHNVKGCSSRPRFGANCFPTRWLEWG
jgi:hypothetical protein